MIYGVTGHQEREGIDWTWVRARIEDELVDDGRSLCGLSALAKGADQVFAEVVLAKGGDLTAIVPMRDYERCFEDAAALVGYRRLLAEAEVVQMPPASDDEAAFLAAGIRVADDCEVLVAVWDGEGARGSGGTADVVAHALQIGRSVVHLQPILRLVNRL